MPELRLQQVSCSLQKPWDLTINAGSTVTLTGPSGSGKSRLLRSMVELDPVTQGNIWIDARQRSQTDAPKWRQLLGYLPAQSHWWDEHVSDHFEVFDEAAFTALELAASLFNAPVSQLSSGEKQRLGMLRLLAHKPQALLLDEPTANLDAHHTALTESLIASYQQRNKTPVIWITHDHVQATRVAQRHFAIIDDTIQALSNG